jgi:fucose 4-O-acetylase-like acetyltransferase
MSLLWWRISLPFLLATGYPLATACLLSLLAGIAPFAGYEWSLSRTLVFLPFFVAGHRWTAGWGLRLPSVNPWAGIALLAILLAAAWMTRSFSLKWYYGSVGYEALRLGDWQGMGYRALYLGLAAIGVAGVLVACSRLDGRIFRLGRYSIGAYILHLYVVKVTVALGLAGVLWSQSEWVRLLVLLSSSMLIAVAGSLLARKSPWLFDLTPLVHKAEVMMSGNPRQDLG